MVIIRGSGDISTNTSSGQDAGSSKSSSQTKSPTSQAGGGSPASSSNSSSGGGTQYIYYVDPGGGAAPTIVTAGSDREVMDGGGKLLAISMGGGSSGASSAMSSVFTNKEQFASAQRSGNVIIMGPTGEITGYQKADAYVDPRSGRIYDPAADRVLSTLARQNPNATPEQLAAYTQMSGSGVMPVSTEYAAAYMAGKQERMREPVAMSRSGSSSTVMDGMPSMDMADYKAAGLENKPAEKTDTAFYSLIGRMGKVPEKLSETEMAKQASLKDNGLYMVVNRDAETGVVGYTGLYARGQDITKKVGSTLTVTSSPSDEQITPAGPYARKQNPWQQGSIEAQITARVRDKAPFKGVPVLGEASVALMSGLEQLEYGMYHPDMPRTMKGGLLLQSPELSSAEYVAGGTAAGFLAGEAIGYTGGALTTGLSSGMPLTQAAAVGAKNLQEVALASGKNILAMEAFGAGLKVAGEGVSSISQSRPFDIGKAHLEELVQPNYVVETWAYSTGGAVNTPRVFTNLGIMSGSKFITQTVTGAASGMQFGIAAGATSKAAEKPIAGYAASGGVLGGAFGAAGWALESRGIKPVFEETRVFIKEQGSPVVDARITGWKAGFELTNTKTGIPKWRGIAWSADVQVPEGSVAQPKGVYELIRYKELFSVKEGPSAKEMYSGVAQDYFSGAEIDRKAFDANIEATTGGRGKFLQEKIRDAGGVIGGRTVESAIEIPKTGLLGKQPAARTAPSSDVDVMFPFSDSAKYDLAKNIGGTVVVKEAPLTYKGFPVTTGKAEITWPGGKIDVTEIRPGPFEPPAPTPLGSYMSSYSFSKTGESITYSPQQQIASKAMTLGFMGGKIAPMEAGKEKYLSDVSAMLQASGRKGLPLAQGTVAPVASGYVTVPVSPAPPSAWKPIGLSPQTSAMSQSPASRPVSLPSMSSFSMLSSPGSRSRSSMSFSSFSSPLSPSESKPPSPPSSPSVSSSFSSPSSPPSSSSQSSTSSSSISLALNAMGGPFAFPIATIPPFGTEAGKRHSGAGKGGAGARVRDLFSAFSKSEHRPVIKAPKEKKGGLKSLWRP